MPRWSEALGSLTWLYLCQQHTLRASSFFFCKAKVAHMNNGIIFSREEEWNDNVHRKTCLTGDNHIKEIVSVLAREHMSPLICGLSILYRSTRLCRVSTT